MEISLLMQQTGVKEPEKCSQIGTHFVMCRSKQLSSPSLLPFTHPPIPQKGKKSQDI